MFYSATACSANVKDRFEIACNHLRVVQDCVDAFGRGDDYRTMAQRYLKFAQHQIDTIAQVMDPTNGSDRGALNNLRYALGNLTSEVERSVELINAARQREYDAGMQPPPMFIK